MGFVRSVQVTPLGLFYICTLDSVIGFVRLVQMTQTILMLTLTLLIMTLTLVTCPIPSQPNSACNDVHSAKVIMMLSQTFYRRRRPSSTNLLMHSSDHEQPRPHVFKATATALDALENTTSTSTAAAAMDSEPVINSYSRQS